MYIRLFIYKYFFIFGWLNSFVLYVNIVYGFKIQNNLIFNLIFIIFIYFYQLCINFKKKNEYKNKNNVVKRKCYFFFNKKI